MNIKKFIRCALWRIAIALPITIFLGISANFIMLLEPYPAWAEYRIEALREWCWKTYNKKKR